jgi:hypothetical protein
MRRVARLTASAVAVATVAWASPCQAQLSVFDPANYQQNLLSALRALDAVNNQMRQLQNEAQMLLRMDRHLQGLPGSISPQLSQLLAEMQRQVSSGEAIALKVQATDAAFERLFQERGLPQAIRSDNGVPFASPNGLFNLSRLSVWWLRLGISIERIKPGHPTQNGRHERMHLTLKKEATRPAGANLLQQQAKFDAFLEEFNNERPHEALAMKCPAEVYTPSTKPYRGIGEPHYPFHDKTVVVTNCGRLCLYRKKINLSTCLAGQAVGIKEVDDGIWLVSFMHFDLGYIDLEEKTLQPLENPFGPKVLPMS